MNLQYALLRPLVAPTHRTEMEHIVTRLQGIIAHSVLIGHRIPFFIHSFQIILVNRSFRFGIIEIRKREGDGILVILEIQTFPRTWHTLYFIHPINRLPIDNHISDDRRKSRSNTCDRSRIRINHNHTIICAEKQTTVGKFERRVFLIGIALHVIIQYIIIYTPRADIHSCQSVFRTRPDISRRILQNTIHIVATQSIFSGILHIGQFLVPCIILASDQA